MIVTQIQETTQITYLDGIPAVRKLEVFGYIQEKLTADQEAKIIEFFKNL